MRAVSLFSGAGGFEIGLERTGIQTVLQAENDPWCLSVLKRHWPEVQRVSDVRSVGREREPARRSTAHGVLAPVDLWGWQARSGLSDGVDLVYGGFPCQDLSVAGNRAGFRGERSSLWFEFHRVLSELRPQWCLIENVPGLLSSANGRDMATVLGGLGDLGYGWAYRVLDARWFGVPQRRRRVFIVGCLGGAAGAQAVLAVCESCGGHPATRREAWEDVAPTLDDGARRASVELPMIAASLSAGGHPGSNMPGRHHEDDENLVATTVRSRYGENGSPERGDLTLVASPVRASDGHHGYSSGRGDGADNLLAGFYTHRGQANDTAYTEDGCPPILGSQTAPGITGAWAFAAHPARVRAAPGLGR